MGKFHQFLTELSARDKLVYSFPDHNLSIYQEIFTKLCICIAIVKIWFRIANGQISSISDRVSARDTIIFSFQDNNLSKSKKIFTLLAMCIDIEEVWFGISIGYISL